MSFIIGDCPRCHIRRAQLRVQGHSARGNSIDVSVICSSCKKMSVFNGTMRQNTTAGPPADPTSDLGELYSCTFAPVFSLPNATAPPEFISDRVRDLSEQASKCLSIGAYDAAGASFRKVIDVATKEIFADDPRLKERKPADALRARIKALGEMKVIEEDVVDLADIVALDGNDAAHDVDPYTKDEAEALRDLTYDLLERLFTRPRRAQAVRAKQLASGARKA